MSAGQRVAYLAGLTAQAADLALHGHTALPLALTTPMSAAVDYFGSKPFANYIKQLEAQAKLGGVILQGINAVVESIGMLGKALRR